MATVSRFGWDSFIIRFIFATVVVFATYNPEGVSYYDWIKDEFPTFTVYQGFVGVLLIIGWIILIRATLGSLGAIGIILAVAFFGLLIWLIFDVFNIPTDSARVVTYIIQIMIICVLSIGVSWSHIRRRISGQVDTDEIDREL
ncbi:MAG: hypothetical protein JSW45_09695 [Thiotrichales bacterium]|nr:MAG: hypothetical protein JSW45_09695 [Thiotrichales bacterium]